MIKAKLKKKAEKYLPQNIFSFILRQWKYFNGARNLKKSYKYDFRRFFSFSDIVSTNSSQKLIGKIIREYHVIEKGLTMPETRLGFGKDLLINLCRDCVEYIHKYGEDEPQLIHAVRVILEYEMFHQNKKFLIDNDVNAEIKRIHELNLDVSPCSQRETTRFDYFRSIGASFKEFAESRASVRNYSSEEIPLDRIVSALDIARTTPSQCNRQCWRTYVYTNKDQIKSILHVQGGSRGFGHLANKLIIVVSELGVFGYDGERNSAYVDGGLYAMNLLYALHFEKIAACILNCSNTIEKDVKLRDLCGIKSSEVFIAMIACGIPPERFNIAISERYDIKRTSNVF